MSSELHELARLCTKPSASDADIVAACEIIRHAMGARDAYVIRAGDPDFIRVGCPCDPASYEIRQRGYWLVWRDGATNPQFTAGLFNVDERLVSGGRPIVAGRPATHIGVVLPADESNSELLVVRGPWPAGLTEDQLSFIETARPILAHLVSNVLDVQRRSRQRDQLAALSDVSNAFNQSADPEQALTSIATALSKASGIDWVTMLTYNHDGTDVADRVMNVARHSRTRTASQFQGRRAADPVELRLGPGLASTNSRILIHDVFDPGLADRPDVALMGEAIPRLQEYWKRAHILSLAIFPLVFQGKALGYVSFSASTSHRFDRAEVEFLDALVSQAATAIKGITLYRDLQESQKEVRQREEWFRSLVQHSSDLITVIDPDTSIRYESPSISRILGYRTSDSGHQRLLQIVHPDDAAGFIATLQELMTEREGVITGEARMRHSDRNWRYMEFTGTDQCANPAINGIVLNLRDVTERKLLEEQLRHQASHDPLTKLANRARFTDRLEHALHRGARAGTDVAVLFMDLDNFKGVNDSLGHSAGDRLLTQVAERVQGCLRTVDTVARLGGDEFAILLEDVGDPAEAIEITDRIFEALKPRFVLDGKDLLVRASIGIAISDRHRHGASGEALLRDADTAMYVAKARGKGRCEVFEESMQVAMIERLELLADLQRAVECHEFVLRYQPVILLATGQLFGVEALVRWQHPRRGLIQPADFIPLAEDTGVILQLGAWILHEACRQAAEWERTYPRSGQWTLSVNVSAKQLQHPTYVAEVARVLRETRLPAHRLILEITESVMMQDVTLMMSRLRDLKQLGVRLAIDDFGTGYSSLSYLRQFPFDLLKIDKSFIDDVTAAPRQKELTRAIIELGKTLELELVAEGIENPEQLSRLQSLDCEFGQGYYFAEPLEPNAVSDLLAAFKEAPATEEAA